MLRQYVCFWGESFPMKMAPFCGSYVAASLPLPYFLKTWSLASFPCQVTNNSANIVYFCLQRLLKLVNSSLHLTTFLIEHFSRVEKSQIVLMPHLKRWRTSFVFEPAWKVVAPFEKHREMPVTPLKGLFPQSSPRQPGAPTCPTNCHPLSDTAFSHNK